MTAKKRSIVTWASSSDRGFLGSRGGFCNFAGGAKTGEGKTAGTDALGDLVGVRVGGVGTSKKDVPSEDM